MSHIRADFYLLTEDQPDAHWLVACRLIEKAYLRKHRVFIFCENQKDAELLDELLWTFKSDSFIPHNLQEEGPEPPPPVQIGHSEPKGFKDILINMSLSVPPFHTHFKRIIEIVPNQEEEKERRRNHYKHYRAQGYAMSAHTL
jgi:DNA polymerase-3 subunit chi